MAERAKMCRNCGTRLEDWNPDEGGGRFAYTAYYERCPGCELLEQEEENVKREFESPKGIRVRLRPNPGDPDQPVEAEPEE